MRGRAEAEEWCRRQHQLVEDGVRRAALAKVVARRPDQVQVNLAS